jgi:hypothetical protein
MPLPEHDARNIMGINKNSFFMIMNPLNLIEVKQLTVPETLLNLPRSTAIVRQMVAVRFLMREV